MNRTTLTLLLSTACTLAACSNKTQTADNNMLTADEANGMMATNNSMMMNGAATTTLSQADSDFVTSSIEGDTAEIAMAQLAGTKATTQGIKDFAQMLVTDHGAHKQQLIDLANSAGLTVPTEPSDTGAAQLQKLQGLSGAEFDKTYIETMIGNHHKGIAKNEKEAQGTGPAADLAQKTLPVLKKHLAAAEKLQ